MAEIFDNSKPMDIEEMTDSQFENWTRTKQNEIAATTAGGQVPESARIMLQFSIDQYITSATLLRKFEELEVSSGGGKLTRNKKKELLPMFRKRVECSRKLFSFANITSAVMSSFDDIIIIIYNILMQEGLSVAANVFKGDMSSSLTKEERKRLEKFDKPFKSKRVDKRKRYEVIESSSTDSE